MAFSTTTLGNTNPHPQFLFSELALGEVGILGEGYMDMNTAEDKILDLVKVLASHPQEATIKRINGHPTVFEISVSQKDLAEVSSKQKAIQAIAGYASGLGYSQFVVKILGK